MALLNDKQKLIMYRTLLILLIPFYTMAQSGNIKIAFMGDSYCNGCCVAVVGDDRPEAFRYLIKQRFLQYYSSVTEIKLCTGGETIKTAMPDWYPGTNTTKNIDTALRSNPDLIILEYSGNHFANKIFLDTVKYCFDYLADTLRSLNKRFVFTSSTPRQTSFSSPVTYVTFQDTAKAFNTWLYANYPNESVNIFDNLYSIALNKPVPAYLGSDSLHWNATGYQIFADDLFEGSAVIDTLVAYEKPRMYNVGMSLSGDSVTVSATRIRAKQVKVYTSTDGISFTERYSGDYDNRTSIKVLAAEYVKLVAINNRKTITLTKQFMLD